MTSRQAKATAAPFTRLETFVLLMLLIAVGAVLRFYRLGARGVFIDEPTTLFSAQTLPLGKALFTAPHFLSHAIVRFFILPFGHDPFWLRLPSAICGVAGIAAFAWMLRRWIGPAVALVGAAWLVFSPYHIYFSIEARYYTEYILLASLSLACWPSLVPRPRVRALAAFLLINITAYGIHPTSIVFFAAQLLVLGGAWIGHGVGWWRTHEHQPFSRGKMALLALVGAALLVAAGVVMGPFVRERLANSNLIALISGKPLTLAHGVGWNRDFLLYPLKYATLYADQRYSWLRWLTIGFFLIGFGLACRRKPLLAVLTVATWAATLLASFLYVSTANFDHKYTIYSLPLYLGLAAWGLHSAVVAVLQRLGQTASAPRWSVLLGAGMIAALQMPLTSDCLRGDVDAYYQAMLSILRSTTGPEEIYTTSIGADILKYHRQCDERLQRLTIKPIRDLSRGHGAETGTAGIKARLYANARPWLVFPDIWEPAEDMQTVQRVRPYFRPALHIEAMYPSEMSCANVWRAIPPGQLSADESSPSGGIYRPAVLFSEMTPQNLDWRCAETSTTPTLTLGSNAVVGYPLDLPRDGACRLALTAQNKSPMALFEMTLDDRPLALCSWARADDSWQTREVEFSTSAGMHQARIAFLSHTGAKEAAQNDARGVLAQVAAEPSAIHVAAAFRSDVPLAYLPQDLLREFNKVTPGNGATKVWQWVNRDLKRPGELASGGAPGEVGMRLPPGARVDLVSLPMRTQTGHWAYGSFEFRLEGLENHSANLGVILFDVQGETVLPKHRYCYGAGLTGSCGWTRLPYAIRIPEDVEGFALEVTVYPNARQRSDGPGVVWIRRPWAPAQPK